MSRYGALPPEDKKWQLGKTAASIDLVAISEVLLKDSSLSPDDAESIKIIIEKVKSGEMVIKEPSPERQARYDAIKDILDKNLEDEFSELLESTFYSLRQKYRHREFSKEEAEALQKMLSIKLGMEDPHGPIPEEGWRKSSWCSEY